MHSINAIFANKSIIDNVWFYQREQNEYLFIYLYIALFVYTSLHAFRNQIWFSYVDYLLCLTSSDKWYNKSMSCQIFVPTFSASCNRPFFQYICYFQILVWYNSVVLWVHPTSSTVRERLSLSLLISLYCGLWVSRLHFWINNSLSVKGSK